MCVLQTKPRIGPQNWRANHYSGFFIAGRVEGVPNGMEGVPSGMEEVPSGMEGTYGCHLPKSHPEPEEQAVTETSLCWV